MEPPAKRSFERFHESNSSSLQHGTPKRLRNEILEAEEAATAIKQPLPSNRSHAAFLEDTIDRSLGPIANPYQYNPIVTHWLESLPGSETQRKRNCRSAIILGHSESEPISRRITKSAPNMANVRDNDGFVVPAAPASMLCLYPDGMSWNPPSSSGSVGTSSSRNRALVQTPLYRTMNLAANNIFIRVELPEHIIHLVDEIRQDCTYPGPSLDQIRGDESLKNLEMGVSETDVEEYFKGRIFAKPSGLESIQCTKKIPMAKQVVPDVGSNYKVSIPVPDMLYGYSRGGAFTHGQQALLLSMGLEMVANSYDLLYPFLYVEFKADGPSGSGSLWVGTNQCLGGSASCVNIVDRLNRRLQYFEDENLPMINNAVFSITMSGTEARVYVSWKHDEVKYHMAKVDSFLLQRPEHLIEFHKMVLNILEWGKEKHLEEIRNSLDNLIEANRRITSQLAKSRPSPVEDISGSSHARREKKSRMDTMPAANVGEPSSLDSLNHHPTSDIDAPTVGESDTSVEEVEVSHSYI